MIEGLVNLIGYMFIWVFVLTSFTGLLAIIF